MDFIDSWAMVIVPKTDPDREKREVMRLLHITRAGSAMVADYAKKEPDGAQNAKGVYLK